MTYKKYQLMKYYSIFKTNGKRFDKNLVLRIDGRVNHGGLCDRLKSAVIVYAICKANQIPFKLYFSHPFNLNDIIAPNKYDWRITENELTKSLIQTKIYTSYIGKIKPRFNKKKQIHVYNFGGGYIDDVNSKYNTSYSFAELYEELFIPGKLLKEQIKVNKKKIGQPYISITFRFQSLLGDFYEGKHFQKAALGFNKESKSKLIKVALNAISNLSKEHSGTPILVTSDSSIFLQEANKLKNVFTIPGKTVHMDFTFDENIISYMKAFIDLYMLSYAEKIYRVSGQGLYKTGFPKVAAFMENKEIIRIKL